MNGQHSLMSGQTIVVSRAVFAKIARKYRLRRVTVCGSAASGELRSDNGIGLLVELEPGHATSLGGLAEIQDALTDLLGARRVDLATPGMLNNPCRRRAIERDMEQRYVRRDAATNALRQSSSQL
jgi:predicted nucleotidyltransferase